MLARLFVKNVALISEADIEFDGGLNVLSGETGSGKSVILDSINFVLGCKADRTMIRYGENEALVRAEFLLDSSSEVIKKLADYDIESDGTVIISRKLSLDGKGAIKINGNTVTASMLKNITQHLVDVHGQSEHFFLLSEENQLKVIDSLCSNTAVELKEKLSSEICEKKKCKNEITKLGGDEAERARKLDLLSFQISEIDGADLKSGEYEELRARRNVLANVEKIMSAINSARSILNEDGGCGDGLNSAARIINQISGISDEYSQICTRLDILCTEVADVAETLTDVADSLTFDEAEAENIEDRITLISALRKKYGKDETDILKFRDKAQEEYEALSDSAALIEKYTFEIEKHDENIFNLCKRLTELRKRVSENFCNSVEIELKTLNIPNAKFGVRFNEYDKASANLLSANGSDEVSFEFSANKGEPLKSLNKVISGGEMSRFMLAIKTCLKDLNGISTYIFDEIDAGISGYTAVTVAGKFKNIAKNTQIIAVSHLPQVCAASSAQFLIYKEEENGKTITRLKRLNENEKVQEIIRLTGGNATSKAARLNAKELILQFKN